MPEPTAVQPVASEVSTAVPPAQTTTQATTAAPAPTAEGGTTDDLLKRVSAFKPSEAQPSKPQEPSFFDIKEIDKISDPRAKEIALQAYKSMQSDYTRKTQTVAEERKAIEELRKHYEELAKVNSTWTPERIQRELQNPSFVESAQAVAGVNPTQVKGDSVNDGWSALSDADKQEFLEIKRKQAETEQYIKNLQAMNQQAVKAQEDAQLKAKYANYNAQAVDIITNDLLQGKVNATREALWKVIDYEEGQRRAYQLGLLDAKTKAEEKVNSMSFTPNGGTQQTSGVDPQKGESNSSFWQRIVAKNLASVAGRK